jgi:hypothetical protein
VFGYVIPGLAFLTCVVLFEYKLTSFSQSVSPHSPIFTLFKTTVSLDFVTANWIVSLAGVLALAGLSYVLGHIISISSSLAIDRVFVYKAYGYPYCNMLGIEPETSKFSMAYDRGMILYISVYILARYFSEVFVGLDYSESAASAANTFVDLLLAYTALKICISAVLARPKSSIYRAFESRRALKKVSNVIGWLMINAFPLPYELLSSTLSKYLRTRKSFGDEFIQKYKLMFKDTFGLESEKAGSNNYWLSYSYSAYHSATFSAMLTNWLHLYSYARNLTVAFGFAFLWCFLSLLLQPSVAAEVAVSPPGNVFAIKLLPLLFFLSSVLMLVAYYYLYYSYFSKFVFRSFVFLTTLKSDSAANRAPE